MTEATPTDRELEALKVLWERGEATVREICEAIGAKGDKLAYTTVLSLLQVMEQKGLVDHKRAGKAYVYVPKVRRERTFRSLAGSFLERVFDGAVDEYLVHALDARGLTDAELERLEELIVEARKRSSEPKNKGGRK